VVHGVRLRDEDLEWREADGEILVLDRGAGRYFAVTSSGALLWRLLAGGTRPEVLVDTLTERYGIETGRARADVQQFVEWLTARGLLVP
jgi:hypothetical protein